jgi:acetate kinase
MLDPSSTQHESAKLAYDVYLDRVFGYITQYLGKLYSTSTPVDGLVFSGGIGEKSDHLRADVAKQLNWLGAALNDKRNQQASRADETVIKISTEDSKLDLWVVQTDEEAVCGSMCKETYGL